MKPVYSLMNRIKACKQNNENANSDPRVIQLIAEIRAQEIRPKIAKRKILEFEKCGFPEMKELLRPRGAITPETNMIDNHDGLPTTENQGTNGILGQVLSSTAGIIRRSNRTTRARNMSRV